MTDLKMGHNYDGATPQYERIGTRVDVDGRATEVLRVTAHDKSTRSTINAPAPFGLDDTPEAILGPVERDIASKRELLSRSSGFDPRTGEPSWSIQGERRAAIERELQQLEHLTLPVAQARAREAAAWHAARPTRDEQFQEQLDRQAGVRERATAIADEQEARAMAERILAERKRDRGF